MNETPALPEELAAAGWRLDDDGRAIVREYRFADFRAAVAWMVRAAFEAEALDHHPEWSNVWNRVAVRLTTHDTGGLTARDIELARRFERIAGPRG